MATFNVTRKPDYRDLDLSFTRNRVTNDVAIVEGVEAVKQSIINLVETNFYEKPFRPSIGSNVRKLLFDNAGPLTATFIQTAIEEVIVNYEPRATLHKVVVLPRPQEYGYLVTLFFSMRNVIQPVQVDFFLKRIR